jgi:hypothetical protein
VPPLFAPHASLTQHATNDGWIRAVCGGGDAGSPCTSGWYCVAVRIYGADVAVGSLARCTIRNTVENLLRLNDVRMTTGVCHRPVRLITELQFTDRRCVHGLLLVIALLTRVPNPVAWFGCGATGSLGPLTAAVNAQAKSSLSTLAFVKTVGFDDNGNARTVDFRYETTNATTGVRQETTLRIPTLAIVPIPFIQVATECLCCH